MNKSKFKKCEIVGIFLIYAGAALLHFLYDLTNGNIFAVLFGSVNESVWENIKNFILPYVLWSVIELFGIKPPFKQFVVAKVAGLYFLIAANIASFYIYTFFTGGPILIVDLILAAVWLTLSQYCSYRLTTTEKNLRDRFTIAVFLLFLMVVMYFTFTAFPPHSSLFLDYETGTYGVPVAGLLPESVFLPM